MVIFLRLNFINYVLNKEEKNVEDEKEQKVENKEEEYNVENEENRVENKEDEEEVENEEENVENKKIVKQQLKAMH